MKHRIGFTILAALFLLTFLSAVQSQDQPKTIRSVEPVFPEGAKNQIYGDKMRLSVEIDENGRVTDANTFGPLEPCADRNDATLKAIQAAALYAARSTVYQPILDENGKPVAARLNLTYRLRPVEKVLSEELRMTIIGGMLNGKAKALPHPVWPRGAVDSTNDSVMVTILIGEDGTVLSAGPGGGHRDLMKSAIDAACQARFAPTTLKGKPAKVSGYIRYNVAP